MDAWMVRTLMTIDWCQFDLIDFCRNILNHNHYEFQIWQKRQKTQKKKVMKKKTKEGKHDKKVTDDEKDNYNTAGTVKNLRPVRQK